MSQEDKSSGTRRHELPGGGTLAYWVDTDDEEMKRRVVTAIKSVVREERANAEVQDGQ